MTLGRVPGEGEGRGKPSPQDYWELVISIGYGQTESSIRLMTHRVGGLVIFSVFAKRKVVLCLE